MGELQDRLIDMSSFLIYRRIRRRENGERIPGSVESRFKGLFVPSSERGLALARASHFFLLTSSPLSYRQHQLVSSLPLLLGSRANRSSESSTKEPNFSFHHVSRGIDMLLGFSLEGSEQGKGSPRWSNGRGAWSGNLRFEAGQPRFDRFPCSSFDHLHLSETCRWVHFEVGLGWPNGPIPFQM